MIHPDTFKIIDFNGSKGLVFLHDKILVYRRDNKTKKFPLCIDLPGGGRNEGETPFETFSRELFEEFGIKIGAKDLVFSEAFPSIDTPDKVSFFMATKKLDVEASEVKFGSEGTEWMLMTLDEYLARKDAIDRHQDRVRNLISTNRLKL